ncbi:penicillin-binding transpeptidase domain-containing protein, partial [Thermoproteota archaeon]
MRYRQAIIIVRIFFVILACGLFYVQIIKGDYYHNLSKRNIIRVVSLEASRGKILDRNGVILADTITSFSLSVIPQEIDDKAILFNKLSKLLGISPRNIYRRYKKNYLNPFTPVVIVSDLDRDRLISLEENKLLLPGAIIEVKTRRVYPFNNMCSHILGYIGEVDSSRLTSLKPYGYMISDLVGQSGLEEYYDLVLRGEKGGEQVEVDSSGRRVRSVGYKPPKPGEDIYITIDTRIQNIVNEFMHDRKGAVIIMDPYSGEIAALGSYPNYNPNEFIEGDYEEIADIFNDKNLPLFNRAIAGRYPPGSTFKIVTASAALKKNISLAHKSFNCSGIFEVGDRDFHCLYVHGQEDMRDAVGHSCNIYFYKLGLSIGPNIIAKMAHMLGLGAK